MNQIITIAFVDPIVSTAYLAKALRNNHVRIIAIYSLSDLSAEEKKLRYRPELFDEVLYVNNNKDVPKVIEQLKKQNVNYVFYGYEATVPLADKICTAICKEYANNIKTSHYRLDKFHMHEILMEKNISHINQMKISTDDNLSNHLKELENWSFPLIIKPSQGILSIGVKKFLSMQELTQFLNTQAQSPLHSKEIIQNFVIQECLFGKEFLVDTLSLKGKHYLASVQCYEKIISNGSPIYRSCEVVDPSSADWKTCAEYVYKVLDAVELHNGFGHTELFLTENGPILTEVNPRISGASGFINLLAEETLQTSQTRLLLDCLSNQPLHLPEKLIKHGRIVCLQNWEPRKIGNLNVDLIKSLTSCKKILLLKPAGTFLNAPATLSDTVAFVLLANESLNALVEDYNELIEWEANQLLF